MIIKLVGQKFRRGELGGGTINKKSLMFWDQRVGSLPPAFPYIFFTI